MKPFTSKHCTPINYGSPLKQEDKVKLLGEETSEIKKDKKGEYSIVSPSGYNIKGINTGDTIRPASGRKFNPNKLNAVYKNYLSGDFDWERTNENNIKLK